ncbi:MAG: HAMP domain-containing protein, partial [Gemmatimonadaceae bacterium]|nr:HAMP domain-containing protein [Gemmatimonadaceae bacterium]
MRLTQRLLLGALGVVTLLVVVITAVVEQELRGRLTDDSAVFLGQEARLVALQWDGRLPADSLADLAGAALAHRVTLIGPDGVVLGDSDFDGPPLASLSNHLDRPELQEALRAPIGRAQRASVSRGDEELYVAVRSPRGFARVSVPMRSLEEILDAARRRIRTAGALALIAAAFLAWIFSRSVTRPVAELSARARAMADGDLRPGRAINAPGEVGELADALDTLGAQLSARLEALGAEEQLLSQLTESLDEGALAIDIDRRVVRINETGRRLLKVTWPLPFSVEHLPRETPLREALESAFRGETTAGAEVVIAGRTMNVTARPLADGGAVLALFDLTRLRRLEAVRRDFVANVSHELRTPLAIVSGFAETLAQDDPPTEQRRQFVARILSNARRMQRIVDDLLDLSRIESGGWVPNPVRTEIATAAHEALASAQDAATAKGLTLSAEIAPDAVTAFADPTALRQVLGNLVDNAVRHTTTGQIVVASRASDGG